MKLSNGGKIAIVAAVVIIACLAACYVVYDNDGEENEPEVYVMFTNDVHGHYNVDEGDEYKLGYGELAAFRDDLVSQGATVFLLDAGDFTQGTNITMLSHGHSSIEIMNAVGYDAVCPGNHEFDYGQETFLNNMKGLNCPTLCSNLDWTESGESVFQEYTILEKDGFRLGVFGLMTTEIATTVNPTFMSGMTVTDPVAAAAEMVSVLEEKDVDYVIALGHIGTEDALPIKSTEICSQVKGIDLFVDGHSHEPMYITDGSLNGTTIVNTGTAFANIGLMSLTGDVGPSLTSAYGRCDQKVSDVIDEQIDEVRVFLDEKVGHTQIELYGSDKAGFFDEISMGDFCTDVMREKTGADIAFMNGGSIRDSIHPGDITAGMVCNTFPFMNYIVTKELTGSTLMDMMELSLSLYPGENGGFLQFSGMSVVWNPSAEPFHRVVSMEVAGSPVDPDKTYTVACNDYIMSGGNGYTMLRPIPVAEEFDLMYEMIIDYLKETGDVTSLDTGRLTQL